MKSAIVSFVLTLTVASSGALALPAPASNSWTLVDATPNIDWSLVEASGFNLTKRGNSGGYFIPYTGDACDGQQGTAVAFAQIAQCASNYGMHSFVNVGDCDYPVVTTWDSDGCSGRSQTGNAPIGAIAISLFSPFSGAIANSSMLSGQCVHVDNGLPWLSSSVVCATG